MGFSSTADWINEVIIKGKTFRYDWIKVTSAVGPYTAGRWYDMAINGILNSVVVPLSTASYASAPPPLIYGEWLFNPLPVSASGWTFGSAAWTYSANTFAKAAGGVATLSQPNLNCVSGRTYRVAFTIASNVGTGFTFALNGGSASALQTATGTVNLVAGATTATGLVITPGAVGNTVNMSLLSIIESLGAFQLSDTSPCGAIQHGGNVSPDTKHIMGAGVQSAAATMQGTWVLCDYLLCYPLIDMNSAAVQTLSNVAFTLPRYTDGIGVRAFLVTTSGIVGASANNMTLNYTNSTGSTTLGQTPAVTIANTVSSFVGQIPYSGLAAQNFGPFLPMAPGDNGVRSVQSIQFTVAGGTANTYAAMVLARPLLSIPAVTAQVVTERDFINQMANMPRVYDGAYLNWLFLPAGATVNGSLANGYLAFCWG